MKSRSVMFIGFICIIGLQLTQTIVIANTMLQNGRDDLDAAVGRIVLKVGAYDNLPLDSIVSKEVDFVFPCLSNNKRLDFLLWASYYFKDSSSIYTYLIDIADKYNLINEWRYLLEFKCDNSNDKEMKMFYETLLHLLPQKR